MSFCHNADGDNFAGESSIAVAGSSSHTGHIYSPSTRRAAYLLEKKENGKDTVQAATYKTG